MTETKDQFEGELMDLQRQPISRQRERRVVRRRLAGTEAEEAGQRAAVLAASRDAALTVDPFEVADEEHPEVDARRQTLPSRRLVVGAAAALSRPSKSISASSPFRRS